MDLIGLPIQIICGKNSVKDGTVEIKYRNSGDVKLINISDVVNFIKNK
jgi:prolyl-tRNA synthetase